MMKNAQAGGKCFILHRTGGMPWFLYDIRDLIVVPASGALRVTSDPMYTGYTEERLVAALEVLLNR